MVQNHKLVLPLKKKMSDFQITDPEIQRQRPKRQQLSLQAQRTESITPQRIHFRP